ncbi:MAG: glycosyltransferase family 4 protein [Bacteroidales bacterium]|nr:glycosyltransferase family 4 protein [Bacteroidales bacterium]
MTDRKRILFILHLPPPVHGASMVGAQIRDSRLVADAFDTRFINLSASRKLGEIERFSFRKVTFLFHLLREVRKTVREWKPDLVYVTPTSKRPGFLKDYVLVRMLKRKGCRIIAHMHNAGVSERQGRWLDNRLYSKFFPGLKVIQLSESLYPDIQKYVPAESVFVCPNGVAEMPLPAVPESSVPTLLFFSNLLRSKGIFDFVDTCKILKEKGIPFRADIAGGETADLNREGLETHLKASGLEDIVSYHGPAYDAEKAALFARADIFVFPSYLEAFGLVAAEAMSAGLPVVATTVGSVPDMVAEGENGFLVAPGDVSALSERVERLLSNPELRQSMGRAGLARYREKYSQEQFEKRIVAILADA